jgi:hypothetical protein
MRSLSLGFVKRERGMLSLWAQLGRKFCKLRGFDVPACSCEIYSPVDSTIGRFGSDLTYNFVYD